MLSEQSAKTPKVVLDTNNLISAHINDKGTSARVLDMSYQGKIVPFTSPFQLEEFKRVLSYPRIKKRYRLDQQKIDFYLQTFKRHTRLVYPQYVSEIVRDDPDDNKILAIALEAEADFIISGDAHLLKLGKYKGILIVSAQEYVAKFT